MQTEPSDVAVADLPAMPDDVAAAWASVLLDVHEKQTRRKADDTKFVEAVSQRQESEHDD